jgi:hypothetical protein
LVDRRRMRERIEYYYQGRDPTPNRHWAHRNHRRRSQPIESGWEPVEKRETIKMMERLGLEWSAAGVPVTVRGCPENANADVKGNCQWNAG